MRVPGDVGTVVGGEEGGSGSLCGAPFKDIIDTGAGGMALEGVREQD